MRPEPMGRRSRPVEMAFRHSGAAMAPGPARLKAAVDVIVDHLRRLVLREAWDKWQPTLSQGEVASRILERQRLRLGRSSSVDFSPSGSRRRRSPTSRCSASTTASADDGHNGSNNIAATDPTIAMTAMPSRARPIRSHPFEDAAGSDHRLGAALKPMAAMRAATVSRGRSRVRSLSGGRSATVPYGGGNGDRDSGGVVRCIVSPAVQASGEQQDRQAITTADVNVSRIADGVHVDIRNSDDREVDRRPGVRAIAAATLAAEKERLRTSAEGDGALVTSGDRRWVVRRDSGGRGGGRGRHIGRENCTRKRTTSLLRNSTGNGTRALTLQTCFKEERESFIRDLQVLHRQLESKDRDHARREKELLDVRARARAEARTAQVRADTLLKEVEEATAGRTVAEANAEAVTEGLDRQTAVAENLRLRLRHSERQHKEEMDLERRQQRTAIEEGHNERRRLEASALTARKALADERRDWGSEKDTLLVAVKEASHRAEWATGQAEEAKAHAAMLEERLKQTLEREASLNADIEVRRASARELERRAARAEAVAVRERAAAAAQEEAFLKNAKDLEHRASRAEMMQGGEQATREDMQTELEKTRDAVMASSSEAQREVSAVNLKAVSLAREMSALRDENEALRGRIADAEALARSADASTEITRTRLDEACRENLRLVSAAAEERELLQQQWRRREKRWNSASSTVRPTSRPVGDDNDGRIIDRDDTVGINFGLKESTVTSKEVGKNQATAMRLSLDREKVLRQSSPSGSDFADIESTRAGGITAPAEGVPLSPESGAGDGNVLMSDVMRGNSCEQRQQHDQDGWQPRRAYHCDCRCVRRNRESGSEDVSDSQRSMSGRGSGIDGDGSGSEGNGNYDGGDERCEERHAKACHRKGETPEERRRCDTDADGQMVDSDSDGQQEKEDALLAPRGGPPPVPSQLTPRNPQGPRACGSSGRQAARKSVDITDLLRTSLERERGQRRWEHDTLLALLQTADIAVCCSSCTVPKVKQQQQQHQQQHVDKDSCVLPGRTSEAIACASSSVLGTASPAANSVGSARGAEGERNDRQDGLNSDSGEARLTTPLTPQAWNDVLEALERSLMQLRLKRHQRASAVPECSKIDSRLADTSESGCSKGRGKNDAARSMSRGEECCNSVSSASLRARALRPGAGSFARADANHSRKADKHDGSDSRHSISDSDWKEYPSPPTAPTAAANLSAALSSALRELLSSTLGLSAEGVREAPLPDLVGALQREWEALLQGLAAMQEEVATARQQADEATLRASATLADARAGSFHNGPAHGAGDGALCAHQPDRDGSSTDVANEPGAAEGKLAEEHLMSAKERADALEATLAEWKARVTEGRLAAEKAAGEAADKLLAAERERSGATARLSAALDDLSVERRDGAARVAAFESKLEIAAATALASASTATEALSATQAAAATETSSLRRALEDRAGEAQGLRAAMDSAQRRAELAEERARELEQRAMEEDASVTTATSAKARQEGRDEGRREAEQRVEALERALEELAETGSAAEGLSKEQLEITRELSIDRDALLEEQNRSAKRLDQLTVALREQREEKARLADQVLEREQGLEALQAQSDVERQKVTRLQVEVEKAQDVCREMTDRLLELQDTQEELRSTRDRLAKASQELESLHRSQDHLSGALQEARQLRQCLDEAKGLNAEMSERAAAAELRADQESRRGKHMNARLTALQHQLDQMPEDLLVAHAEKRVLKGALNQAAQQAADAQASSDAELRRRDADIRTFASAAALQQERCGERLREQALTIHQLTLENFSAEAQAEAREASRDAIRTTPAAAARRRNVPENSGIIPVRASATTASIRKVGTRDAHASFEVRANTALSIAEPSRAAAAASALARTARLAPRTGNFKREETLHESQSQGGFRGMASPIVDGEGGSMLDKRLGSSTRNRAGASRALSVAQGVAYCDRRPKHDNGVACDGSSSRVVKGRVWEEDSLDSGFPPPAFS